MNGIQQAELNKQLLDAVIQDNVELIEKLIMAGARVNAVDDGEGILLRFAALTGKVIEPSEANIDIVRQLGLTSLHYAVLGDKGEVLELLIEKGTNVIDQYGDVLLCLAAGNDKREVLELLLAKGGSIGAADHYGNTLLHLAAVNGKKEMTEHLIKNKKMKNINAKNMQGITALCFALAGNHRELAEFLLENGADINVMLGQHGDTLLHYAAKNCKREVVELLTKKGLSVSAVNQFGLTPLHCAAYNGQKEVVEFLLEKGADINVEDQRGTTPFYFVVENSDKEMVESLIKNGANINAVDHFGNTILHAAAFNKRKEVVEFLLENGAYINAVNAKGMSPLYIAIVGEDRREVLGSLLENGADINPINRDECTILEISTVFGNDMNIKLTVNHIAKLEVAGLYISERILQQKNEFINTLGEGSNNYLQHFRNCEEEVKKLEREDIPLYDFLKESNIDQLASIWEKNEDVRNKFDNQESLKEQYPEYARILINKANEVKKEIFLHNHKPLIDELSTHYKCDFKTMIFAGVKNFFKVHKDDLRVENISISLINSVDLKDITTRHIPALKVKTFAKTIRNKDIGSNLEYPSAEQTQGASQSLN